MRDGRRSKTMNGNKTNENYFDNKESDRMARMRQGRLPVALIQITKSIANVES